METNERRAARNQALPPQEVNTLRGLHDLGLYIRCAELYKAGWPLRAIGEAFDPPRARSTVKSWVDIGGMHEPRLNLPPVEAPKLRTDPEYVPLRPVSPGIDPDTRAEIKKLAPVARLFRSAMKPNHACAIANDRLTEIVTNLHAQNVPVSELADAAGVTYRAMAKRLGRA